MMRARTQVVLLISAIASGAVVAVAAEPPSSSVTSSGSRRSSGVRDAIIRPDEYAHDEDGTARYRAVVLASSVASSSERSYDARSEPPTPVPRRRNTTIKLVRKGTLASSLAFLAGVSDVVCHKRFSCFANMMTGNAFWLATSIGDYKWIDAMWYSSVISAYACGMMIFRLVDSWLRLLPPTSDRFSLRYTSAGAVAPVVLLAFVAFDVLSRRIIGGASSSRWLVPLLALGYGVINVAGSESTNMVTTMMTGHMQKITFFATDSFIRGAAVKPDKRRGAWRSLRTLMFFFAGVISSTYFFNLVKKGDGTFLGITLSPETFPFWLLGIVYAALLYLYKRPLWESSIT